MTILQFIIVLCCLLLVAIQIGLVCSLINEIVKVLIDIYKEKKE